MRVLGSKQNKGRRGKENSGFVRILEKDSKKGTQREKKKKKP